MSERYERARALLAEELRRCGLARQAEAFRNGEIFRVDSYVALQCIAKLLPQPEPVITVGASGPMIDRPCRDGCDNPDCCPVRCCGPLATHPASNARQDEGTVV